MKQREPDPYGMDTPPEVVMEDSTPELVGAGVEIVVVIVISAVTVASEASATRISIETVK